MFVTESPTKERKCEKNLSPLCGEGLSVQSHGPHLGLRTQQAPSLALKHNCLHCWTWAWASSLVGTAGEVCGVKG